MNIITNSKEQKANSKEQRAKKQQIKKGVRIRSYSLLCL